MQIRSRLLTSSGHVPTLAKVTRGTTSTFTKISLWQRRTADQVDTVFFLHWLSCCHSPVYSHYISGQALWDCIIKLTGSITVLLQPWPTLYSPTLKHCLHWLLLWYTTKLKCPWFLFFRYCNSDHPRSPRPIKMWEDPSSKSGIGIILFLNLSVWLHKAHAVMISGYHSKFGCRAIRSKFSIVGPNNTAMPLM